MSGDGGDKRDARWKVDMARLSFQSFLKTQGRHGTFVVSKLSKDAKDVADLNVQSMHVRRLDRAKYISTKKNCLTSFRLFKHTCDFPECT